MQRIFNPINYGFDWTHDWYTFDRKAASAEALKERNAFVKKAKAEGRIVRTFSLPNQLITRGGIGSGHPQIEVFVTCYGAEIVG